MPMAVIAVRKGPRGPLAHYVQAVRRGMAGRGLGQDDTTIEDPTTGIYYDPSGNVVPQPVITPITTDISSVPLGTDVSSYLSQLNSSLLGSTPATGSPATASNASGSNPISSILSSLTATAASAGKLYQSLQTPALIPGTNAIYNAATGQYYNPTTGQVVNPGGGASVFPAGISTADLGPVLLYGGLALGALLLFSQMGKH